MRSSSWSAIASSRFSLYSSARSLHPGRYLGLLPLGPEVVLVDDRFHLHKIHNALELGLGPDRQLYRDRVGPEPLVHGLYGPVEVSPDPVHLVDERDPGYPILVSLPPDRLTLRLDTSNRVEQRYRTVKHPQASLHLHSEVHVPGRVYDIDTMLFGDTAMKALLGAFAVLLRALYTAPEHGCGGGSNSYAALALLGHPVHNGVTVVDLAQPVGQASIEQDSFSCRRLSRVDMSHDPDVPDPA